MPPPQAPSVLVFVGGVHGVGKTTALATFKHTNDCGIYSASGLIREAKSNPDLILKSESTALENQQWLIWGINSKRNLHKSILLDGHFSLSLSTGQRIALPLEVFHRLDPKAIALFEDSAERIHTRLISRDKNAPDIATITEGLAFERDCALRIAFGLKLKLKTFLVDKESFPNDLSAWIKQTIA